MGSSGESGYRGRRSWRSLLGASAALAAGALLALGMSSGSVAGQTAPAAREAAPAGLFRDLRRIDVQLSRLINDERRHGLSADALQSLVDRIHGTKIGMVNSFFYQTGFFVNNGSFGQVFSELDCVDTKLEKGVGDARSEASRHLVKTDFNEARRCEEDLKRDLSRRTVGFPEGAPKEVLAALTTLDQMLSRLIEDERTKHPDASHLLSRVIDIGHTKLEFVREFFDQPMYGVRFYEVFSELDRVDTQLQTGVGWARGGGFTRQQIEDRFKDAQKSKQKLETEWRNANPPEPSLRPIHAVFTPAPAGQGCSPPYCTTVYTENATGQGLTYQWAVSIPADPNCANGFQPNKPRPNQATWYHADTNEGGPCNHTGSTYDEQGRGHPGTVVVNVTDAYWSCAATYYGTQGDGTPFGNGPAPQACQPKAKP